MPDLTLTGDFSQRLRNCENWKLLERPFWPRGGQARLGLSRRVRTRVLTTNPTSESLIVFPRSSPSPKARPFSHGSSRRDTVVNTNATLLLGATLPRLPQILYILQLVPLPLGSREVEWQIAFSNGKDRDSSGCESNLGRKLSDSHPSWMAVRYCPSLSRATLENRPQRWR